MPFKLLSSKFACYAILVFPFGALVGQILGLYARQPFSGVTQELGFIAINCLFIIFVSTMAFILKPSIFSRGPLFGIATYRNFWIPPFMALVASGASLYNAYEIHSQFGFPLILLDNGEELRLAQPINKWVNLLQSFWFVALPLVLLVRNRFFTWFLVASVIIYSVYIGNRGAILFLLFMSALNMQFSIVRMTLLIGIAMSLILAKAYILDVGIIDYFLDLSTSQAQVLNSYINVNSEFYWGWFTYVRLFGPLLPGEHLSLLDLQNTLLNIQFDGLYVASAYVYPYLDFGLVGVIFFQYFNCSLALLALRKIIYWPVTCSVILFGLTISFYDSLFNQLFFWMLVFIGLACDILMRKGRKVELSSIN